MTRIADEDTAEPIRVGMDMSILRHPHTGSARWAAGLLRSLRAVADLDLRSWMGPGRVGRGGPVRKLANLMIDTYWLDVGLPREARR